MAAGPPPEPTLIAVDEPATGTRLDAFLAERLPSYSRVQLRRAIADGGVLVDGLRTKVAYRLRVGQSVSVLLPAVPRGGSEPENIPIDVLYEDDCLIAINKPPGMVVHPARGHWSGTLTAALVHRFQQLSSLGGATRPGIVHRLDRDTSGVIVVAKTDRCHMLLAEQFESRTIEKEYFALVAGVPDRDRDWIEQPIGPHPHHREKMAIRVGHGTSREARTFYEVVERLRGFAAVAVKPKTGRTHQIRVHLAHIGFPVLCDKLYGGRDQITQGELGGGGPAGEVLLDRQALHALRLTLTHPETGIRLELLAPLPDDILRVLDTLRHQRDAKPEVPPRRRPDSR